jgi:hypothetical protein
MTTQQTTVTTRTEEKHVERPVTQTIQKDAIVTNVMEKPVLSNVIEQKHVEVHHKPVVQEIHEQKIIEIEKQNVVQNVQKEAQFSQARAETRFEEIGSAQLGEQERLRLASLHQTNAPKVVQEGSVRQVQEQEVVGQVIKQETIERHVQPVVTEVREQKVVQEVLHPVVRTVHEAPIIREVTGTTAVIGTTGHSHVGHGTTTQTTIQQGANTHGNTTVTTQTNSGLHSGTTTTSSMGSNAVVTEQKNLLQHEQKVINKEGGMMSGVERSNLAQHEKVVDSVTHNQHVGTTQTHGTTHNTTHNTTHGFEEEKPGLLTRMKEKLHIGGHHDNTTHK